MSTQPVSAPSRSIGRGSAQNNLPSPLRATRAAGARARRARLADVAAIHGLIAHYAAQGVLLPRSEQDVRDHIGRFLVLEEDGAIAGCAALEPYGPALAEVRSLAIDPAWQGRGLGARLVRFALAVARRRKIARVFAVTHAPEFFLRLGFSSSTRAALPEKIERDCRGCQKHPSCRLDAVVFQVVPESVSLPVLAATAGASPAR